MQLYSYSYSTVQKKAQRSPLKYRLHIAMPDRTIYIYTIHISRPYLCANIVSPRSLKHSEVSMVCMIVCPPFIFREALTPPVIWGFWVWDVISLVEDYACHECLKKQSNKAMECSGNSPSYITFASKLHLLYRGFVQLGTFFWPKGILFCWLLFKKMNRFSGQFWSQIQDGFCFHKFIAQFLGV